MATGARDMGKRVGGMTDRRSRRWECRALLASVEDTRLLRNQNEPPPWLMRMSHPPGLWHKEGIFKMNSAQAATCQISRSLTSLASGFLPTSYHCLKPPHAYLVSSKPVLSNQSHETKLRQAPLELKETTATPRSSCSRISCPTRQ